MYILRVCTGLIVETSLNHSTSIHHETPSDTGHLLSVHIKRSVPQHLFVASTVEHNFLTNHTIEMLLRAGLL